MGNPAHPERRGKILIDREFQLRFIGRLGGVLFFYLLLFLVVSVVAPVVFTLMGEPPEWAIMETAFRVQVLLRLVLAPLLCTFLCLFAHGVIETFRIAGPNYRFKVVSADLGRGILPRGVRIRQTDYLQDTAREMHKGLVALHDRVAQLQEESAETVRVVERALPESGAGEELAQAMAAVQKLDQRLREFQLVTEAPACRPVAEVAGEPVEPLEEPAESSAP